MTQLKNDPAYKPGDVAALAGLYDSFLTEFPKYYNSQTASDYALLEAQYANDAEKGIEILQKAVSEPDIRREMAGRDKLQMGDYYVLTGKVWDASLTYSQVDKEFKQDELGEDARFRNAKLAYYRGDFDWAQSQLSVLKAATSDLIANDALYLSVLITENVVDSNILPLQRFAYADLLLFQNKDKEAETLLDSITLAYPKHPLNDNILMLRAEMAKKHRDYEKALMYLKKIKDEYGEDVLGDDAVFKMADIYQNNLHQNDKAKQYYEQLIIDYPGSTYVQIARQKLSELNNNEAP
jgi:outer membrane protein assembly factor BamD (BamD/ComL family)